MRPPSIESAKKRAWTALARYVRKIEPRCVTCGGETTEAGHYRHNSDKKNKQLGGNKLWYDIRNIHGQDSRCNRWLSGNLSKYALFLEEKYGPGILQELQKLYLAPRKWTIPELLEIEAKYNKLYDSLD